MDRPEGWGREEGRSVYMKLINFIESNPGVMVFKVSLDGVQRLDISFASETIVEAARRYRGNKGFCLIDPINSDILENLAAAAQRKDQPLMICKDNDCKVVGVEPSQGNFEAFTYAIKRASVRVSEFVEATPSMSVPNASNKFRQLWEKGFLLRREEVAESGGVEYTYHRIC
jgi:hypothetical protein